MNNFTSRGVSNTDALGIIKCCQINNIDVKSYLLLIKLINRAYQKNIIVFDNNNIIQGFIIFNIYQNCYKLELFYSNCEMAKDMLKDYIKVNTEI